jgi:putative spermidine/putrescine transport system permease protein
MRRAGVLRGFAAGAFIAIFAVFILGPFVVLGLWSVAQQWFWPNALPTAFTLRWFQWATVVPGILASLRMSLLVAILITMLTTVVALPASFSLGRLRFRGQGAVRALFALPLMVPYISLGIGIATVFYRLRLTDTVLGVVLAHSIATLPFGILILTAAFEELASDVEEAALACGANRWQTFRRVSLPLLAPAILAQAIYVFTLSMDEFTLTLLVSGADTATLPVQIFASIGEGYFQISSALSVLLLVPSLLVIYFLVKFVRVNVPSAGGG